MPRPSRHPVRPARWIWQHPDWPRFSWDAARVGPVLRQATLAQGRLLGKAAASEMLDDRRALLDTLLSNILTTSSIEGETLDVSSVRSSLAKRLGVAGEGKAKGTAQTDGLADLILEATGDLAAPLTAERLFHWHRLLFPAELGVSPRMHVGDWRGESPMQVVSGRLDRPTVHYEAPPREGLEAQVGAFLDWFNGAGRALDPVLWAAVAHFWFVTLHPFDDGNGRLARAVADLALAQGESRSIRLYTMAAAILADRKGYYRILESSQRGTPDITAWMLWFLETLMAAFAEAEGRMDRVVAKTRFWRRHRAAGLLPEQVKALNRLLDGGADGFPLGISAAQYGAVAKVSKATATRHLADLVAKGLLRPSGAGRSTRYAVA